MIYNIETLSQSELLHLLIVIHNQYGIDAINANHINEELNRLESLNRQKQIAIDIENSGLSRDELLEVLNKLSDNKTVAGGVLVINTTAIDKTENVIFTSDNHLKESNQNNQFSNNQPLLADNSFKNIRLKKVATELNVGIHTIVEFLEKNGYQVDTNPNTRINQSQYELLLTTFQKKRRYKSDNNKE